MNKKGLLKRMKLLLFLASIGVNSTNAYGADNVQIWGNPDYGNMINDDYESLPDNLKQYFSNIGCDIYLLDGKDAAEELYEQYAGERPSSILGFSTQEASGAFSVYVESSKQEGKSKSFPESSKGLTDDEFNYKIAVSTLYHELAHIYDWGYIYSGSEEFINIYNNEVESFTNTKEFKVNNFYVYDNICNSVEYFATAFCCYFNYPDDLMTYCPDTYNYLNNIINNTYSNGMSY